MTKVDILRHPTEEDWQRCKMLALSTVKENPSCGPVSDEWKHKILRSGHSPIRTLMFTIRMEVPYWVSVHFVRHKYGVEHYVKSQRNDRQSDYDRTKAPQDAMVQHVMDINAQELIHMAGMRLCGQASKETRDAMLAIRAAVKKCNPEFDLFMVPKCVRNGGCNEFVACGYYQTLLNAAYLNEMEDRNAD